MLPNIPEVGTIERKDPIKSMTDSWIGRMCADFGYTMTEIADIMHINDAKFLARYKNGVSKPQPTVELLCLFGYKAVDEFYPRLDL